MSQTRISGLHKKWLPTYQIIHIMVFPLIALIALMLWYILNVFTWSKHLVPDWLHGLSNTTMGYWKWNRSTFNDIFKNSYMFSLRTWWPTWNDILNLLTFPEVCIMMSQLQPLLHCTLWLQVQHRHDILVGMTAIQNDSRNACHTYTFYMHLHVVWLFWAFLAA